MTILLTGGTGYIGSAVLAHLVAAGHDVTAVVRSASSAEKVTAAGARALVGDLTDIGWLTEALAASDGAIHTATPGDATTATFDDAVATAVIRAFSGTGKPYIHTSGIWVHGSGSDLAEDSPIDAPPIVAWRDAVERRLLEADVATTILEPAIVYGHAAGIPRVIVDAPRTASGELELVGDGTQHWATVHVDDLAALYSLVIARGDGLGRLIGAGGISPTVRELGEAAATGAGVAATSVDAARERLGTAFADALLLDQQASGAKARSLGWIPTAAPLTHELAAGYSL